MRKQNNINNRQNRQQGQEIKKIIQKKRSIIHQEDIKNSKYACTCVSMKVMSLKKKKELAIDKKAYFFLTDIWH